MQKGMGSTMEKKLMSKILREREVKLSELPDDFDIESLPEDITLIFDDDDPTMDDDFWEDEE